MKLSIKQIASLIGAEIEGDPLIEIHTMSSIDAGEKGAITFLANPKYSPYVYTTGASAIIIAKDFEIQEKVEATLLRVDDPYSAVASLLEKVESVIRPPKSGREEPSFISEDASIGKNSYIGAFAYIGKGSVIGERVQIYPNVFIGDKVVVGDDTIIYPGVSVYTHTRIGKKCIIHAGSCIGSDGFGFAPQKDGTFKKIPQMGRVVLEDEVELGANTCIDRATFGDTLIKKGAKLDNLVQLAHNVEIGEHTVIAAQSGIAGSTKLGRYCMLGGQVGVVGHLQIADRTMIDAQSGVNKTIKEEGKAFRGSPIQPHRQQLKSELMFRKLEEMYRKINELEKALEKKD